jgi:predicted nuclease of restriction endonuclease-like (RecB) superfamily
MDEVVKSERLSDIRKILLEARTRAARKVNDELLRAYWQVGRLIVEVEQEGNERAEYGRQLIDGLSKTLTKEFGTGFSRSNLKNMRSFYLYKQKSQTVSGELTWSHYCEILSVSDPQARNFYEKETLNANWSVRELRRQIDTSLFERLLLAKGKDNREKLMELAERGVVVREPADLIKDPYVFEFLGLPEREPVAESELEASLIGRLREFMLELGKGFMFVGSQRRITLDNVHYYVDLVFYNKILKAYVLIDLKTRKFRPGDAGQMNAYLSYFEKEVNEDGDGKPVGIILCADKDEIVAEYAFNNLANIYASRYMYVLPEKEKIVQELNRLVAK